MIDELFDLSRHFILNYNRNYQRYFMGKYPLENRFSIITGPRDGSYIERVKNKISKRQYIESCIFGCTFSPVVVYIATIL